MGRKKYYCDFCDRYFNDDKNTRQKHLNSVSHWNLKKEHYNMFRAPESVLEEESVKKPCRKFHIEGYCPFGGSCTFSHYSQQDLNAIRYELLVKKQNQQWKEQTIESWLLKYKQRIQEKSKESQKLIWSNQLPPELSYMQSSNSDSSADTAPAGSRQKHQECGKHPEEGKVLPGRRKRINNDKRKSNKNNFLPRESSKKNNKRSIELK